MTNQRFAGRFQMWCYDISHSCLLLRRPKSARHATQVDVLFKGVRWIDLPSVLDNLEVRGDGDRFHVRGDGVEGHVVAAAFFFDENELDYHDPSPLLSGYSQA